MVLAEVSGGDIMYAETWYDTLPEFFIEDSQVTFVYFLLFELWN